ncbi:MAG: DUF1430 domain-containing protein [Defluviitaleaceae bacterium]|nr:DUF1430 domain-containing protein [Defluviitaleaceae bacterium]
MKKIITVLFVMQLFVASVYGLLYLRSSNFYDLIFQGNSMFMLNFGENLDDFEFFLNLMNEHDLIASRVINPNETSTIIYTTDPTLGGRVGLIEGEFPVVGSPYFISTVNTKEEGQIGLIDDMIPNYQIMIFDINSPRNFTLDGFYQISTQDEQLILTLLSELGDRLSYVRHFPSEISSFAHSVFSMVDQEGLVVLLQILEFVIIFPIITLCLAISLIHHALKKLKESTILLMHGYSKLKILGLIYFDMIRSFLMGTLITYMLSMIYLLHIDQRFLLIDLTLYFVGFVSGLIVLYLIIVGFVTAANLKQLNWTTMLKGRKIDKQIQVLNHGIKAIFSLSFLLLLSLSIWSFMEVNQRLSAASYWEIAQNVHQIRLSPQPMDWDIMAQFNNEKVAFYHDLINYHSGFTMNSNHVWMMDSWIDEDGEWRPPQEELHLLNRIDNVEISPGFLQINPIYTVDGELAYAQLILDDDVINVLLPERFDTYKEEILAVYLEHFGDEVTMNIIQVHDNQYYFTFDRFVRERDGNRVKDPLAIIFHGPVVNEEMIASAITHSFYFVAETSSPFAEIESLIHEHGLQSQIQRIEAVYDQFFRELRGLQEHQTRLMLLIFMLLVANFSVAYNLITNYFERHKFEIFLKSKHGWRVLKQNKTFLMTYFAYSIPLVVLMAWLINWLILLIGIAVLMLDVITMLFFQDRLLKKSFSEIMKGER